MRRLHDEQGEALTAVVLGLLIGGLTFAIGATAHHEAKFAGVKVKSGGPFTPKDWEAHYRMTGSRP